MVKLKMRVSEQTMYSLFLKTATERMINVSAEISLKLKFSLRPQYPCKMHTGFASTHRDYLNALIS